MCGKVALNRCRLYITDWRSPFDLQRGWLLWGAGGVLLAGPCVVAAAAITSFANGEPPPRDVCAPSSDLIFSCNWLASSSDLVFFAGYGGY